MSRILEKYPFSADMLADVADFDCGDEPWSIEVADWIRNAGPGCVLDAMRKFGTEVWIYGEGDDLIGFGSLGASGRWRGWERSINIIPMLGVRTEFQGQPRGQGETSFARQIVRDLIAEARTHPERDPALGLFYHPSNQKARHLYLTEGFTDWSQTYTDRATGTVYPSMLLKIATP